MTIEYLASDAFVPDNLIAGDSPDLITDTGTLLSGNNLKRGTLIGKVTPATAAAVAGDSNVGNGLVSNLAPKTDPKLGTYTLTCLTAATNGGTFSVVDPDGINLGTATVGTAFTHAQITLKVNDGTNDFHVGDTFTISMTGGLTESLSTATDGSQTPYAILVEDVDATSANVLNALIYIGGAFNSNKMTFGASHTAASTKAALRDVGIILKIPISA